MSKRLLSLQKRQRRCLMLNYRNDFDCVSHELLEMLFELDIYPDCKSLIVACQIHDGESLSLLADYGVDVLQPVENEYATDGDMRCFIYTTSHFRRTAGTLIENGTLLHVAAGGRSLHIVELLIDRGIDVEAIADGHNLWGGVDNTGEKTALKVAVEEDRPALAETLIRQSTALLDDHDEKVELVGRTISLARFY